MKSKKLFVLILALMFALSVMPAALAEGETPITQVDVTGIRQPSLTGVNNPYFRATCKTEGVTIYVLSWNRCPADLYGTANEDWSSEMSTGTTFTRDYYFRVSVPVTANDGYVFADDAVYTINGNTCTADVAADKKSATLTYVFSQLEWDDSIKQVTSISASFAEPALGKAVKHKYTDLSITGIDEDDTVRTYFMWEKISEEDYKKLQSWDDEKDGYENKPDWEIVGYTYDQTTGEETLTEETFQTGYYYRLNIEFVASLINPPDFVFSRDITLTLNGKKRTDFSRDDRTVELQITYAPLSSNTEIDDSNTTDNTPTTPVTTVPTAAIPSTGDSVSTLTVAAAMILMSAVVAFVAMRKREN
jgi:LPXTG-motif cell wall-anchored protein